MQEMDAMELDILREIGTIGAGNATTSLSVMLNSRLSMGVPKVSFMNIDDFVESIGGAENIIAGIMSNIVGEVSGFVLFAINLRTVYRMVSFLKGTELEQGSPLTEYDLSAVKEIGNILISSYLASIETLTGLQMRPSVPVMSIDMAGAILNFPIIVNNREHDEVLRIESQIEGEDVSFEGHIVMIPSADSYPIIKRHLGY